MADFLIRKANNTVSPWRLRCSRCHTLEVFESFRETVRGMDTHARWFHIDTDWFDRVVKKEQTRDHLAGRGDVLGPGSGEAVQLPGA